MDFVENLPHEEELIGVEIEARVQTELFQRRIRRMFCKSGVLTIFDVN
ncbi:hypothetical protein OROMI_018640 [Orobanche minor]